MIALGLASALAFLGLGTVPAVAQPEEKLKLPVSESFYPQAEIGFHDLTRTGEPREIREDLSGDLNGMVELVQASSANPVDNSKNELPTTVAARETLLLFTPQQEVQSVSVEARIGEKILGNIDLHHPNRLPSSDQNYDQRGKVAYSLRSWSATLPWQWVQPGLQLTFTDQSENSGQLNTIDTAAPKELVINNIQLGMLTDAPVSDSHRFINDPANGATDYFQPLPISKMTMAQYEAVKLAKVIVASGEIFTPDNPDPSEGSVYAGTMRENVGMAQVSTGINLATFGITSAAMIQRQPAYTNQRVIHHSAGLYANGRITHGLSGGNGMATLYSSVGNELSHELGHSFGLGHYPGRDASATGDDIIRNASHHMDSGWGYIPYRGLMRSNLDPGELRDPRNINGDLFAENLAGKYNFNTDAMAGGWDASPVSDYTHHTGYSLNRIQQNLTSLTADTKYSSGYRNWDQDKGAWVDAKELEPEFDLPQPVSVGDSVFALLGGYNRAQPEQTVLYPAFRSNYGVTFDLPQSDPNSQSAERSCWVAVRFADQDTEYITLDASDGVKQLNVNIAEDRKPTAAQIYCRTAGTTTALGNEISIATDLDPMPAPVLVGQEAGFETLRQQELAKLEPVLEELSDIPAPLLDPQQLLVLRGWSDDLSALSPATQEVADRILRLEADALSLSAYLAEHGAAINDGSRPELETLTNFLQCND